MINEYHFYVLITAFFSAVSQILLNVSAAKEYRARIYEYVNPWVITAYVILALVLFANVYILRFLPLKTVHVIAASTYIFVMILSRIFFKEPFTFKKVLGNILIFVGIIIFVM